MAESVYQELALNPTSNDLPTLKIMLNGPNLIESIATKYSITLGDFMDNLTIDSPGSVQCC